MAEFQRPPTRMLDGTWQDIRPSRIVGHCTYSLHPGAMTLRMYKDHGCEAKGCAFFKKNENAEHWRQLEKRRSERREGKARKKAEKLVAQDRAAAMEKLRCEWQALADSFPGNMQIIRVEKKSKKQYLLYYVSDHPFGDAFKFVDLCAELLARHPQKHFFLRHIRDQEGNYITTEIFQKRRRN